MAKHIALWLGALGFGWTLALGAQPSGAPASEASRYGTIAGRVTDRSGLAQAGVSVTILRQDGQFVEKVYTQNNGRFRLSRLLPGVYAAEVVQSSFLPFWKSAISVKSGAEILLEINLLSLAESVEVGVPESLNEAKEEWKWVLRSSYPPRPILRFQETPILAAPGEARDARERALRGTVQVAAGNESHGFGQDPGLRTAFDMAYAWKGSESLGLAGSAGFEHGTPAASFRAGWNRSSGEDGRSTLSVTMRQLFLPSGYWVETTPAEPSGRRVQSVTMGYEQERELAGRILVQYGSLFDMLRLAGQMRRWSPFGRITVLPTEGTRWVISYTAASPRVLPSDWDPERQRVEQWLAIPQVSAGEGNRPVMESGRHLEALWEQQWGSRFRLQAAAFYDSLSETALSLALVNSAKLASGLLRDPFSDRYFLSGGSSAGSGARVAVETKLSGDSEVTVGYSYAPSLQASAGELSVEDAHALRELIQTSRDHSFAVKVSSAVPWSRTRVIASYRWLPRHAVAVADPYDRGMGRSDPFLNLFVLQPIPSPEIFPGQFEAVADFNNLLAQGYVTLHSPNGGSGYLFSAARSFRGGFNFIF